MKRAIGVQMLLAFLGVFVFGWFTADVPSEQVLEPYKYIPVFSNCLVYGICSAVLILVLCAGIVGFVWLAVYLITKD